MLIFTDNPIAENLVYLNKGVDGMFTEFPHMTYSVYEQFSQGLTFPELKNY